MASKKQTARGKDSSKIKSASRNYPCPARFWKRILSSCGEVDATCRMTAWGSSAGRASYDCERCGECVFLRTVGVCLRRRGPVDARPAAERSLEALVSGEPAEPTGAEAPDRQLRSSCRIRSRAGRAPRFDGPLEDPNSKTRDLQVRTHIRNCRLG